MNRTTRHVVVAAAVLALSSIETVGGRTAAAEASIPSSSFTIGGAVQTPKTLRAEDLETEPVTTETVYFSTGKGPVQASFTGVLLWTLLQEVGIRTDPAVKNDIARRTILVTGSDGYGAALSVGEIDPEFGGGLVLLAYARDGQRPGDGAGAVRLVVPGDKNGGRNVQEVVSIEVR